MLGVSTFQPPQLNPSSHSTFRRLKPHFPFSFSLSPTNGASYHRPLRIHAIDAAQLFDYESKVAQQFHDAQKLKIAVVGFGNFGQFLARTLVNQGHTVLAHSRSDYTKVARELGVTFFRNPHDLCEEHPEVILLCSSIISTQHVLLTLPLQRLKRSTLFVDVLSVKEFPKNLLLEMLPSDFDILCSHPMFGPESASRGWSGLPFVFEKVRIGNEEPRIARCEKFLHVFAREGCRMVEMSCADHDRFAAGSQFITHTVGRILEMLTVESTPINTKGYESLLNLVENTCGDSFDLYYGLFMFNKNSLEMLERLDFAFEDLRKQLIGRLHGVVRKQLFENAGKVQCFQDTYAVPQDVQNGSALVLSSKDQRSCDVAKIDKYKSNGSSQSDDNLKLKIAIVGFGNFGQFLAKTIARHGHQVLAYSRSDYSQVAQELGVSYFNDADDLCEQHPEVILLCTSILSTEKVLKSLPVQRLKRSTLFVDVLSVKEFPRNLFLQHLPPYFDVLCTHPMFGPESGKNGWKGLPFVYDKVRVGRDECRTSRCDRFLDIFSSEGCRMVEMSCAEHDCHAAGSQFITHTTGRFLEKLKLEATPIDTKGYETLLSLVENTAGDSFDLYYGLFLYNINAMEQLEKFDLAFESLKKQLFDRLHGVYRKQVFQHEEKLHDLPERSLLPEISEDSNAVSSFSNTVDTK
ncbi:arogenate dehydrogenase 1, chloroplastic isoform X2 [Abrus precatorius]|uniref:Arogenate dehydrogenase 1, chloroplastic isoform X2 n=1 Tax=Abrus precatorius TaxID=3816 RepID=A0A8B8JGF2_ABRPR|nr:arogenate dehydrogenase 1, chloroplastic isoform X2 [Abrus precatorius]XP_027330532.1 arogenate dehydrogenase 1, chloroplastic isoform X2 [Abrus precatorius]